MYLVVVAVAAGFRTRYCCQRERVVDFVDFALVEGCQMFRMPQKPKNYWQVAYFRRHSNFVKIAVSVAVECFQMPRGYFQMSKGYFQKYL